MNDLNELRGVVIDFTRSRGWENDSKNVAMSITIEAAEIMELFQWKATGERLTNSEVDELSLECADVLWYLLRICHEYDIDLGAAVLRKHTINSNRFPLNQ